MQPLCLRLREKSVLKEAAAQGQCFFWTQPDLHNFITWASSGAGAGITNIDIWRADLDGFSGYRGTAPYFFPELEAFLTSGPGSRSFPPLPPRPPPPPPPPPPPLLNSSVVLIGDGFTNRTAAAAACAANSSRLCMRADLANKSYSGCCCRPGWCEDWEGWWAPTTASGCGHAGFNSAPKGRAAGAFCCSDAWA